ncbi:alkaline phosphatase [Candidatus Berkelbacteria bacterium RIFCSPHIGHO2_12_FULL_36_9]|uniref:Alkaline phosphatase n=1 Tax=Candidatus Berkelbacteria bacterium RIFCSPHIGHO2_12_FULL_36_9 TaxID=1797469 RepID=A0A1F5EIF2_9BACT|nr:MAG: alkaline phosphatase [Candidatus Berkelbacteria bacterium RIFCSPHIGHO2_12_FULL_36_9]
MITAILETIGGWIVSVISDLGYLGIVLLMAIESANIPLPSEIIMPFSGYLVSTGQFNLWWAGFYGAVGCVVGSILSYWLGAYGGRPLVEKYGKYILISHHDLDSADRFFKKYGDAAVFIGRLLPVVRTFISFPAGIARMNFGRFVIYSFLGSLPFTLLLAYIGQKLGENREILKTYFHRFDIIIGIIILAGIVWYIWRHVKNIKYQKSNIKN